LEAKIVEVPDVDCGVKKCLGHHNARYKQQHNKRPDARKGYRLMLYKVNSTPSPFIEVHVHRKYMSDHAQA
jgi:hypothetical protein